MSLNEILDAGLLAKFNGNKHKVKIFQKVRKIVSEQLDVREEDVQPDSNLFKDFGADSVQLKWLVAAIQGQFGIEIENPKNKRGIVENLVYDIRTREVATAVLTQRRDKRITTA